MKLIRVTRKARNYIQQKSNEFSKKHWLTIERDALTLAERCGDGVLTEKHLEAAAWVNVLLTKHGIKS